MISPLDLCIDPLGFTLLKPVALMVVDAVVVVIVVVAVVYALHVVRVDKLG